MKCNQIQKILKENVLLVINKKEDINRIIIANQIYRHQTNNFTIN